MLKWFAMVIANLFSDITNKSFSDIAIWLGDATKSFSNIVKSLNNIDYFLAISLNDLEISSSSTKCQNGSP